MINFFHSRSEHRRVPHKPKGPPQMNPQIAHLVREKLDQAGPILDSMDIDCWLCFARETRLIAEPALELINPYGVTWKSAFLICRDGQRIAVVGRFDAGSVESLEAYTEVVGYDESIRPALVQILRRINPRQLAINFSKDDPAADGLTVGMRIVLDEILAEAGIETEQLESAAALVAELRGLKSASEVSLIRQAIATTENLLSELTAEIVPGRTEAELAAFLQRRLKALELEPAWELEMDPAVDIGPNSQPGHRVPGAEQVQPGRLVHVDFGIQQDGYCSDLQRTWYVLDAGETAPPDDVLEVWGHARGALLAGAGALKPAALGWEVDQAARGYLTAHGLPEYMHAFGHNLGRAAHDGGTLLGPRWERYGQTPYRPVKAGNVYAIELMAPVPGQGWVSLEEDVLVTDDGLEWLSTPQSELIVVPPA
jgi:Xaa-Pro aminopeptidase